MNTKESFRFQNKLQHIIDEAQAALRRNRSTTKVVNAAVSKTARQQNRLHKLAPANPDAALLSVHGVLRASDGQKHEETARYPVH